MIYKANSREKVFKNYYPEYTDADAELYLERDELAVRSWDAYRNIPLARGIVEKFATSVIGTGLTHHSNVDAKSLGISQDEKKALDYQIDSIVRAHTDHKECDYYRLSNFYQLQRQAIVTKMVDGSVLGLLSPKKRNGETYLTIKNIEGIQLCSDYMPKNNNKVAGGVEIGRNGVEAYYMYKYHPYSSKAARNKCIRIKAYTGIRQNVIHYYDKIRSGQRAGVSILSSIFENLMQMDKMTEAKLTRSVLASMLAIVFHRKDGLEESAIQFDENGREITVEQENIEDKRDIVWKAGMIYQADPDEGEPTLIDPKPDETYKDFVDTLLNEIGSAVGMPRSIIVNEFRANYTASRGELLEFWKSVKNIRSSIVADYCQPYKEAVITHAVATGKIEIDGYLTDYRVRNAVNRCRWEGAPMGMIDIRKEIEAYSKAKEEGFMPGQTVSKNIDGSDYEQNLDIAINEADKEYQLYQKRSKMEKSK